MKKTLTKISLLFTFICAVSNAYSQGVYFGQPASYAVPNDCAQTLDTADFNNDGYIDIIVGGSSIYGQSYSIFLNQGNGTFPAATAIGLSDFRSLAAGDFNNDNYSDFAILQYRQVDIYINNTTGAFNTPITFSYDYNTELKDIAVGDFNGDGNKDIALVEIIGNYENYFSTEKLNLQILIGSNTGSFTPQPAF